MHRVSILALTALLMPVPSGAIARDAATVPSTSVPVSATVTIDAPSTPWRQRIEWGLERFRAAGLALPPLVITIHDRDDAKAACGGNTGQFLPHEDPAQIRLCPSSPPDSRVARLITLHELAHGWAETQLTATQQEEFVRLRGLEVWADQGHQRHRWAAEHAAEVVSWALMDERVPIIRIDNASPAALAVAFESLVGRPPPA